MFIIILKGKTHLEKASLFCLKMLEVTLEKQNAFLDGVRESGAPITVFQLDKLLLGINPRSGRADHLANISRCVCVCLSILPSKLIHPRLSDACLCCDHGDQTCAQINYTVIHSYNKYFIL